MKLANLILDAYNDFMEREYCCTSDIVDFNKPLPIAYTEYEIGGEERGLQVNYNLIKEQYENYIDDELILVEPVKLKDFIEDLKCASFDDFIRNCLYKGYEIFEQE